jgi:hypothetical protein
MMNPANERPSVPFDHLAESDLVVGSVYRAGTTGSFGDDPISKVIGGGNRGGFRYEGTTAVPGLRFVVLFTTFNEPEWPDRFEDAGRRFIYYGDNRQRGQDLHDTPKRGNLVLRETFGAAHSGRRQEVPPIFVFSRWRQSRDVIFEGLAVPGAPGLTEEADLVAFWKTHDGERFLNYRAGFAMLSIDRVTRDVLRATKEGRWADVAPPLWTAWRQHGAAALATQPEIVRTWHSQS